MKERVPNQSKDPNEHVEPISDAFLKQAARDLVEAMKGAPKGSPERGQAAKDVRILRRGAPKVDTAKYFLTLLVSHIPQFTTRNLVVKIRQMEPKDSPCERGLLPSYSDPSV